MFKAAAAATTIEDRIEKTRALEKYIMHDKVYAIVTNKESKKAAFRSYMKGFVAPAVGQYNNCLLYTSPSPRDATLSRMPSSA